MSQAIQERGDWWFGHWYLAEGNAKLMVVSSDFRSPHLGIPVTTLSPVLWTLIDFEYKWPSQND